MRFWAHQAAEYVMGMLVLAGALQASNPAIPLVAGALLIVLAATADGPLKAFSGMSRPTHKIADLVMIGLFVVGAVLLRSELDATGFVLLIGPAAVLVLLVLRTDYSPKVKRQPLATSERSEAVGRAAGKVAAQGVRRWRARR